MAQLTPVVSHEQAVETAQRKLGAIESVELVHYPMIGIVFELHATRGPARSMNGQYFYTVVDPKTKQAFTTDPFEWDGTTGGEGRSSISKEEAISIARHSLAVRLMRRIKLAGSFELRPVTLIDPLHKPNWYILSSTTRMLVDGLNGSFTSCPRKAVS